ncbi:MAG: hypothetical protein AAFX09_00840 [Pseudomonadota bacterium]
MGAAFAGLGLTLSACTPADQSEGGLSGPRSGSGASAIVTAAFEPAGAIEELIFLPNREAPWTGLVAASTRAGGFDIYNIDGELLIEAPGPRLRALAAAPDFQLRGNAFPLLIGLDSVDEIRAFLVIRELGQVVEAPMDAIALNTSIEGLCTFEIGIGYVDIAVLGADQSAEIWRVSDTGEDILTAERQAQIRLPFPARSCAGVGDDLLVGGPTGGLARLNPQDGVIADAERISINDFAYTELLGRPVVITPDAASGGLSVFDARDLDRITDLQLTAGLNSPALANPGALAASDGNFGGMAYSSGVLAIYDGGDSRVKIVAREVLSRAVASES